jgi:hypothetical protein
VWRAHNAHKERFVALIRQQTGEINKNYYFRGHNEEITVREADSDTAMFFPLSASRESSVRARVSINSDESAQTLMQQLLRHCNRPAVLSIKMNKKCGCTIPGI